MMSPEKLQNCIEVRVARLRLLAAWTALRFQRDGCAVPSDGSYPVRPRPSVASRRPGGDGLRESP
jgi:hypothetical protein